MANPSNTSMSPDPDIINDVAVEMGIDPAFVEKDWFSVQTLKAIAAHQSEAFVAVFSGGTSLSKGYGLIQRFSEDLDFRCLARQSETGNQMKKKRRAYREGLLKAVNSVDLLALDTERVETSSKYIKFELGYPRSYQGIPALREGLQVEFSFTQPRLEPELRVIQSFVSLFAKDEPETEILCLSPIEIAADKLCALTWRVLKRNRSDDNDDPAMIRHLHDIAALRSLIEGNQGLFIDTAASSFKEDQKTPKRNTQLPLAASIEAAVSDLEGDKEYDAEYDHFVDAMSYAGDDDIIDFNSAMTSLREIGSWFE